MLSLSLSRNKVRCASSNKWSFVLVPDESRSYPTWMLNCHMMSLNMTIAFIGLNLLHSCSNSPSTKLWRWASFYWVSSAECWLGRCSRSYLWMHVGESNILFFCEGESSILKWNISPTGNRNNRYTLIYIYLLCKSRDKAERYLIAKEQHHFSTSSVDGWLPTAFVSSWR